MSALQVVALPSAERERNGYPIYREAAAGWIGTIPTHWSTAPLKALSTVVSRGNSPEYVDDGRVFVLNQACIQRDGCRLENRKYQRDTDTSTWKGALRSGDVVINSTGTGTLGRVAVFDAPGTWIADGHVTIIRTRAETLDPFYLMYLLIAPVYQGYIYSALVTGATNQVELSREGLRSLAVVTPPLGEQRAIVAFLDRETAALDALVAKKRRLIALLAEKRAALIARAVTRGLDPAAPTTDSGVGWLGEIPAHWQVRRLRTVTDFVTSGSRGWAEHYADDGPMFLRIGNLSRNSIDLDLGHLQHVSPPPGTEGERTRVQQQDVLISITAYIGSVAVVDRDLGEAYVNQHIALTRPNRDAVVARWLGYSLVSPVGQEQFRSLLYGGTKDGLGLDDVRNLYILVPPRPEQESITAYLDRETAKLDALNAKLRETIAPLGEYRTALIAAAVTGQIDVRGTSEPVG